MTITEKGFKNAKLVGANDLTPNSSTKTVTVLAGQTSGTAAVTSGSTVLGCYPAGNQDEFVDNVATSGTTLTVTLAAAATANNVIAVNVVEP
jgi:hypothetical protein